MRTATSYIFSVAFIALMMPVDAYALDCNRFPQPVTGAGIAEAKCPDDRTAVGGGIEILQDPTTAAGRDFVQALRIVTNAPDSVLSKWNCNVVNARPAAPGRPVNLNSGVTYTCHVVCCK